MRPPPNRNWYRPGGQIDFAPFVLMCVITLGVAILAGFVVEQCTSLTMPGVIFGPLIGGLLIALGVAVAVHVGRCRSPWIGATLGVCAGLTGFFAAFQFQMVAVRGNDHLLRVDLLPDWMDEHVHNDVLWRQAKQRPNPADGTELSFRWLFLSIGGVAATMIPALAGWFTGAKPFSEAHQRWLRRWGARMTLESGREVARALFHGDGADLALLLKPVLPGDRVEKNAGFSHIIIEYLPNTPDTPVYVSVLLVFPGKGQMPRWEAKRWELTATEAAAIADGLKVPYAAFASNKPGTQEGDRVSTDIGAKVVALPDEDAGLILCRRNLWIATLWGFVPLLLGLGGAAVATVFAVKYSDELESIELGVVIAAGVVSFVASLAWLVLYSDFLPARYLHSCACRVIRARAEPVVDPDSPAALFVQIIPRQNWGRIMLENASEVGFLVMEETWGTILYEGDRERWAIPRESVISCELESFDIGPGEPSMGPAFWLVVLKANAGGRVWEVPLAPRPVRLQRLTPSTRRRGAEELRKRILRALEPGTAGEPPASA